MTESLPTQADLNPAGAQFQGDLYPDYEAYELDLKSTGGLVADFAHMYRGRLDNVAVIADALSDYETITNLCNRLRQYATLSHQTDDNDAANAARTKQLTTVLAQINNQLRFFAAELKTIPEAQLQQVVVQTPQYAEVLNQIVGVSNTVN